jgi:hypothetical protein
LLLTQATDPLTIAAATIVLALIAAGAGYVPARTPRGWI